MLLLRIARVGSDLDSKMLEIKINAFNSIIIGTYFNLGMIMYLCLCNYLQIIVTNNVTCLKSLRL